MTLITVWNLVYRSQCSVCAPRQFSDWSCTNQWSSWSSWRCSSQLWQRQTCPYCMTELWTSFIHCHNCVVFEQLTEWMMFFYYLSDYVIQPLSCHNNNWRLIASSTESQFAKFSCKMTECRLISFSIFVAHSKFMFYFIPRYSYIFIQNCDWVVIIGISLLPCGTS